MRTALRCSAENIPICLLTEDPATPRALFLFQGDMIHVLGEAARYREMFEDLLCGRIRMDAQWPPAFLESALRRTIADQGFCSLFFNTTPVAAYEAALEAGFQPHPQDHGSPPAYLYYFEGFPRFADLVLHPCRIGQGAELLELMKLGVSYDEDGHYTRMCLENGPSFVCEVDGVPVCWSCTHLNGTMGMIYTPEQHRRKGYARSLAAFQIDHMLATTGFACCHVVEGNTASEQMVLALGARRDEIAYCWRSLLWPAALLPAALRS